MENQKNDLNFDLEDILREFGSSDTPAEAPLQPALPAPEETAVAAEPSQVSESTETASEPAAAQDSVPVEEPAETAAAPVVTRDTVEWSGSEAPETNEASVSADTVAWSVEIPDPLSRDTMEWNNADAPSIPESAVTADTIAWNEDKNAGISANSATGTKSSRTVQNTADAEEDAVKAARSRLQLLKKKLIAGPEKRYYDLSEQGVSKLQFSIALNFLVVIACIASAVLFAMNLIPENRLRFMVFSQVLAMLVSATLGSSQLVDGVSDLLHGKFNVNTLLVFTFAACIADAVFCLRELRVPCCAAFALEMTFSQMGTYYRRSTELSQMDTLRKAVKLIGISKMPEYADKKAAILRREGDLDDFWETYRDASAPQKIQNVFAFISLICALLIAAGAGFFHGPSMAVQALSAALLISTPAGAFIALTRPAALLEKRLHMVGSVLCGWKGVKGLKGKVFFPLFDEDLFPAATTKLNGVKFYGQRRPNDVIAYTASVICEHGGNLGTVFEKVMTSRNIDPQPVLGLRDYGNGGIGAEVRGEPVLVGNLEFMQSMGIDIPTGTAVNNAIYASISGMLMAVYAISYAKMRSATAGMVSMAGCRRLTPLVLNQDFMLTERFIREKFEYKSRRILFPQPEIKEQLQQIEADPALPVFALSTRQELISSVYAVSGANVLSRTCRTGLVISLLCSIIGILCVLALGILGQTALLTPLHVIGFELLWLLPTILITEWARTV